MQYVINAYNGNTEWLKEYTSDPILYDKKEKNVGYNIYDYMDYIVKNYDNLPDIVLFGKDNMLERHITKEEFDKVCHNTWFTPLLTQHHQEREGICWYEEGIYCEKNDGWYFNSYPYKYFNNYPAFAIEMGLPNPPHLRFSPGGCYIVPKKHILKRSKAFYEKLRGFVEWDQHPAEAHAIERSLYEIWS